jgi:hypothetical protein
MINDDANNKEEETENITNEPKINTRPTHLRIIIEDDNDEVEEEESDDDDHQEDADEADSDDDDQEDSEEEEEEEEEQPFPKRHGVRWSNSEIDALYCEFEIREYDIYHIAERHQRTCSAILFKLRSENLIDNLRWNEETQEYEYEARYMKKSDEWDDSNSDERDEEDDDDDDDDDEKKQEQEYEECDITTFANYNPTAFDNILFAYYDRVNNMIDNIGAITSKISNGIAYVFG